MEIKHEHIQTQLLALAAKVGQAAAACMITENYHRLGGGSLPLVVGKVWNNQQNIYHRWIECRTPQQCEKIIELGPAIFAAADEEISLQEEMPFRVANASKECTEATNAVLRGLSPQMVKKEVDEAKQALDDLLLIVSIQLKHMAEYAA